MAETHCQTYFCNPSEGVKKSGEPAERNYLQSFRIVAP